MKQLVEVFSTTPDSEKKTFLDENIEKLNREETIDFYKGILQLEMSPLMIQEILLELDKINFSQKKIFQKFLKHKNALVVKTASAILNRSKEDSSDQSDKFIKLLYEGDFEDREYLISNLLSQKGVLEIKIIMAVLKYEDAKLRNLFVSQISDQHIIHEDELADIIKKKGTVWYARAAIVEILGKRKSSELFNVINLLINDVNVEVKLKLINALVLYPKEKVKDFLHSLCNDKFLWVRKEAKKILSRL